MVHFKAVLAFLAPAAAAASCNADNCLRGLRASNRLTEAQAFCGTFTTAPVTATSAIPTFAVQACTGNVASRVSSACSCIATSTSAVPTTTVSSIWILYTSCSSMCYSTDPC